MDAKDQRIAELEDALKDHERRIADLREERDGLREQLEECSAQIERWIEAFNMVPDDDGVWCWQEGLIQERDKWLAKFQEIRADWNKFVGQYNAVAPRNMGRPLHASKAQQQRVLSKHAAGQSLRSIAEEMELGLQTVRTIIDKKDGLDRARSIGCSALYPTRSPRRRLAQAHQRQPEAQRRAAQAMKRFRRGVRRVGTDSIEWLGTSGALICPCSPPGTR